jgi:microcin C transport system substrate-binding protein
MLGGLMLVTALGLAGQARAQSGDEVIISHGYSYFGDLKYPADFTHLDYVNPDAPKGGEIAEWAQDSFDSFNQYARKGNVGALVTLPYENMVTTTADDPVAVYCLLCTTMEYPKSLDWVIFNIRPDITFTDGTGATAEDFKFTYDLFMEQGLPEFLAAFKGQIASVEILDPYKIKYTFTAEAPLRDRIGLASTFPLFSKADFEATGRRLDESWDKPALGTGPYVLDSFDLTARIIYRRNPDYWGQNLPINVGRNNFDTIRIEYFADSNAAFEGFKAGLYTFRSENSSLNWATGYDFPAIQNGAVIKAELPNGNLSPGQSFVFNLRREKFQDPKVREAIRLMFNFEWSNETLFYGLYERVESFWGNSDMQAMGTPTPGELEILQPLVDEGLLDASILTDEAVMAPESSTSQLDRGNLRRASALLDEAGWIAGDDGLRRKDGEVLKVEFLESSPTFDRIINPYIENLKRLGIDASLNRVDSAQETERTRSGDWDMVTHSLRMSLEPSTDLKQWFGSETAADSSRNLMALADPAIDRLIDIVVAADSTEAMKTAVRTLDRALRAKGFWVPQWYKGVYTVAYFDQFAHPENLPAYALGEMDFWWYDAEKAAALRASGALR